jgi:putative transcriptional regulator
LTQEELCERFGLSLATLRDWEQGRTEPDHASRTLLKLIARIPRQVEQALAEKPGRAERSVRLPRTVKGRRR